MASEQRDMYLQLAGTYRNLIDSHGFGPMQLEALSQVETRHILQDRVARIGAAGLTWYNEMFVKED